MNFNDCSDASRLDEDVRRRLHPNNPRLLELRRRYQLLAGDEAVTFQWTREYIEQEIDFPRFRADGAYLWQARDGNDRQAFEATHQHLARIDRCGLFDRLSEDGAFGVTAMRSSSGKIVSRDLLDSVSELLFLEQTLGLLSRPPARIVDVGAGYGRFAHRCVIASERSCHLFCLDAIAESTFLCEFYVEYRGLSANANVVPIDELGDFSQVAGADLAVSIHSFSECSLQAISWWLERLASARVRHLFIVPNHCFHGGELLLSREAQSREDYSPMLRGVGYRQVACRPKYEDPLLQQLGVSPTKYYLFELQS